MPIYNVHIEMNKNDTRARNLITRFYKSISRDKRTVHEIAPAVLIAKRSIMQAIGIIDVSRVVRRKRERAKRNKYYGVNNVNRLH